MTKKNAKTADQLRSEIAYFAAQLQQTTSRDRQRRAHVAIRKREQLLRAAIARESQRSVPGMTLEEIAALLDKISVDMANALMPAADDPDRASKAYVLGIASHAVRQRAEQLRAFVGVAE